MRLALFASGSGSNVEAIIQAVERGELEAEIACLFCDNPKAYVIERARKHNIPYQVISPSAVERREDWEALILTFVEAYQVDWIILAGFMRIVGKHLLEAYPNRIINLHPSLLPAFPGKQGILDAFRAKVDQTGVTIHLVDEGIDTGTILGQESIKVDPTWDLKKLEEEIHAIEHRLFPQVIQQTIHENNQKIANG